MSTTKRKKFGLNKTYINKLWINPEGKPYKARPGIVGEREQLLDIADQMEKDKRKEKVMRVAGWTTLWWGGKVSTVWLGIDMSMGRMFNKKSKPIIFESMLFGLFGTSDLACVRYSTRRQAREGHKRMVAEWNTFEKGIQGIKESLRMEFEYHGRFEIERKWNRFKRRINNLRMAWLKTQLAFLKKLRGMIK